MANSADPDQLASKKPTDLDLHCLQRQGISGFSRTRVKGDVLNYCRNISLLQNLIPGLILIYRIRSNHRTYPYKRTVKKFRSLQITASVIFFTSF